MLGSIVCSACGMSTNDPETDRCALPGCIGHFDLTDPTNKPPDELIDTPGAAVWALLQSPESPTGYMWDIKGLGAIIDDVGANIRQAASLELVRTYEPPAYSTIQHQSGIALNVCGRCGSHVLYPATHDEWHEQIGG